jgi:excisionase family DNA binding protein
MSIHEVAETLNLTPCRIYQLIAAQEIPAVKIARRWRVPRAAFDKWILRLNLEALASLVE